jgi:hypothetical protein
MTKYTYGDTALAGERLSLVADLFASSSRALLRAAASSAPDLAVDLGCGPGHTTRLVHAVTGAERTLGLDRSAVFIAKASSMETAGVSFVEHDVTKTPLPVALHMSSSPGCCSRISPPRRRLSALGFLRSPSEVGCCSTRWSRLKPRIV